MRRNILVIDGENGRGESYERLLGNSHRVFKASNREEALREISKRLFHLLIIDMGRPDTENLELLRLVRNLDSRIPIVVISVINTVEMAVETMKLGMNNYLTKPLNVDELKKAVEELLDKVEVHHPLPLDVEITIDEVKEDMLAKGASLREAGEGFEKKLLKIVLEKVNGDRHKAANFLGMDDEILSSKMVALDISA